IDEDHLALIKQRLNFEAWLTDQLSGLPRVEQADYATRAGDLLAQEICSIKLALALEHDMRQENSRLDASRYALEVEAAAICRAEHIKSSIVTELDLPPTHEDPSCPSSIRR
ncbi:MAG TPA: hypothetical protein VJ692_07545, partial [Nitrospiraceae bacterium]|nr:hypothetical protein [Nitrospiraceae bacterium]